MSREAFIKLAKMNKNDKHFLHEPRTRTDFMILVSPKRLKLKATLYPAFSPVLNAKILAKTKL